MSGCHEQVRSCAFYPDTRLVTRWYHDDQTFPRHIRAELRAYAMFVHADVGECDLGHVLAFFRERHDWTHQFVEYLYDLLKFGYGGFKLPVHVYASLMELLGKLLKRFGSDVNNYIQPQYLPDDHPRHSKQGVFNIIKAHDADRYNDIMWGIHNRM